MSTVSSWKKVNLHWVGGWNKVADEIYELTEPDMCAWKTCAEMHLVWASAASNLSTYEELTYSQLISKILLTDCRGQKGICNCSQALLAWAKPSSGTRLGDEVLTNFFYFFKVGNGVLHKEIFMKAGTPAMWNSRCFWITAPTIPAPCHAGWGSLGVGIQQKWDGPQIPHLCPTGGPKRHSSRREKRWTGIAKCWHWLCTLSAWQTAAFC